MKLMLSISYFILFSVCSLSISEKDSVKKDTVNTSLNLNLLENIEGQCLGIKYKWGGESLTGFDCSGFVKYVYKNLGVELPHSSKAIAKMGKKVDLKEARKGDLIIFTGYKDRSSVGHIGIVMDNDSGCLIFTHSSSAPKSMGVVRTNYYQSNYPKRFIKIIRLE